MKILSRINRYISVRSKRFSNIFYNEREIKKIKRNLDKKDFILVWNSELEPWALGNFVVFLSFGRYFACKNKKIIIYFIVNNKSTIISNYPKKIFLGWFENLSKIFLGKKLLRFKILNKKNFFEIKHSKHSFLIFENLVKNKKRVGTKIPYVINSLAKIENKNFRNKLLINEKLFAKYTNKKIDNFIKEKYVCLIFRAAKKNINSRNTPKKVFLKSVEKIYKKFKYHNILIISDKFGCNKAKGYMNKKFKNVFYCKDFSKSLYSDIFLQLSSKVTIASHFAGGILPLSWVSSKPYLTSTYYSPRLRIENADPKPYFIWGNEYNQVEQTSIKIDDFYSLIESVDSKVY